MRDHSSAIDIHVTFGVDTDLGYLIGRALALLEQRAGDPEALRAATADIKRHADDLRAAIPAVPTNP